MMQRTINYLSDWISFNNFFSLAEYDSARLGRTSLRPACLGEARRAGKSAIHFILLFEFCFLDNKKDSGNHNY